MANKHSIYEHKYIKYKGKYLDLKKRNNKRVSNKQKMYLCHNTTFEYLIDILKDGELKSNKLTGNINEGDGIYDNNEFVYFFACPDIYENYIAGLITLFIKPNELYNRKFYISTHHTSNPDYLYDYGDYYTKMYPKNYDKYNYVLNKIYNKSRNIFPEKLTFFEAFQQIAVKNRFPITTDSLVAIRINNTFGKLDNNILKILKKKYPNTNLIYRKFE